ncbi:Dynein heavy chain 1, axonemal, partial [Kappamyces sp. JEL0680]
KPISLPISQTFNREPGLVNQKPPGSPMETLGEKDRNTTSGISINYRKAIEPKVARPFINRLDQTPRKIEMERKKRLYSSLDIKNLINEELNILKQVGHLPQDVSHSLRSNVEPAALSAGAKMDTDEAAAPAKIDVSQLLPLEAFDNTEFDVRTVDDWLDMTSIPDEAKESPKTERDPARRKGISKPGFPEIRFAVVPLPAKAFDGLEWRDCIVIAYDDSRNLWKLKWRTYNGWELDRSSDYIHAEDETLQEEFEVSNANPREVIDGKEVWTHRYPLAS